MPWHCPSHVVVKLIVMSSMMSSWAIINNQKQRLISDPSCHHDTTPQRMGHFAMTDVDQYDQVRQCNQMKPEGTFQHACGLWCSDLIPETRSRTKNDPMCPMISSFQLMAISDSEIKNVQLLQNYGQYIYTCKSQPLFSQGYMSKPSVIIWKEILHYIMLYIPTFVGKMLTAWKFHLALPAFVMCVSRCQVQVDES